MCFEFRVFDLYIQMYRSNALALMILILVLVFNKNQLLEFLSISNADKISPDCIHYIYFYNWFNILMGYT